MAKASAAHPQERLRRYVFDYLRVFGERGATAMASKQRIRSTQSFRDALEGMGCDEVYLTPCDADPRLLERTCEALAAR